MSRLKFDYVKLGPYRRPIIPVRLTYGNNSINTQALIDSGADFNLFHLSMARNLGLNLNINKPIIFGGVGNKKRNLTGYMGVLDLMVYSKGSNIEFSTSIVFSEDIPSNGFPLLGEFGFFDHFEEIHFYYKRGKVVLQDKAN